MSMEDFFNEGKTVRVDTGDGEGVDIYMRFLKVKEFPLFFRIAEIEDELTKLDLYVELIESVTDYPIDSLPAEALFKAFEEMNFPVADGMEGRGRGEVNEVNNFDITFDFLISQGHRFDDIMEYPIPRYRSLCDAARDRVFGKKQKKKSDPFDYFSRMGIPVEPG